MAFSDYDSPVSKLFEIGIPKTLAKGKWVNYVDLYGFTKDDIDALICLASDKDLDWESEYECYAPVHAYRSLGQLRAESAVTSLVELLNESDDNDWFLEDIPDVFAMIGSESLSVLESYLAKRHNSLWGRVTASNSIKKVAEVDPSQRQHCLEILTKSLDNHKKQPSELNGALVSNLIDLGAKESISTIEQAYKQGPMDEFFCGSLARVKIELGLATESDFTPEELEHKQPDWMKPIMDVSKSIAHLTNRSSESPSKSSMELERLEQRLSAAKKGKSTKPKSGFGLQAQRVKKRRKNA